MSSVNRKYDLTTLENRNRLPKRKDPYWHPLNYCRAVGYCNNKASHSYWLARYRTNAGLYHQKNICIAEKDNETINTFEDAERVARKWFRTAKVKKDAAEELPMGMEIKLRYSPIGEVFTLGHALNDYVEWRRYTAAATTFASLVNRINYYLVGELLNIPAEDFSVSHLKEIMIEVIERAPKTGKQKPKPRRPVETLEPNELRKRKKVFNALVTILRGALILAWESNHIDSQRSWHRLKRLPNTDRPREIILNRKECRELLRCCKPDLRKLVLAALYTGCRPGELVNLKVRDVAQSTYGLYIAAQKTRRARYVFLPDEGMAFFLREIEGKPQHEYVFRTDYQKRWSSYVYKNSFRQAANKANLPRELVFHGLRHTYASQLVQSGAPLLAVAQQLGHANINTVSTTYGHMAPQIRQSEVRQRFEPLYRANQMEFKNRDKQCKKLLEESLLAEPRDYARIDFGTHWPRTNQSECRQDLLSFFMENRGTEPWLGRHE